MEFFKCSIGGESYGHGVTEIDLGAVQRNGIQLGEVMLRSLSEKHLTGFIFVFTVYRIVCRYQNQLLLNMRKVSTLMMLGLCVGLGEMSLTLMPVR